ncbi:MAG: glycosyltransferase family 4 protein [Blautia sp.]|nr:glycosyltransferase family 4 protein [Blautia sp.]
MKVNFILPGLGDSGGIQIVKKYVQLLNERGIDTVIYCSLISNNLHRYHSRLVNNLHQLYCSIKTIKEKNKKEEIIWVPKINSKYIREADHTIATMWATAFDVSRLSEKCGKKWYFVQGFEIWDNKVLCLESYRLPLNKIVISTWINNQLKENLGIGPFPVVYNGLDTELFKPHVDAPRNISSSEESKTILMMNHDNPVKGVNDGLMVFEKVKQQYPSARFIMFGLRDNGNLPEYIEYYQDPSKEILVELYQQSDIFLFPSHSDGWGLTPIEAMACGCAVVGTNTGFVLDLGEHGENMMVCESDDIDAMYNNVKVLLDDPNLLSHLKKQGRSTVEQLSWEASTKNLIDVLTQRTI